MASQTTIDEPVQLSSEQHAWNQTVAAFHDVAALIGGPSFVPAMRFERHVYGTKEQQESACRARDVCIAAVAENQKYSCDEVCNIELLSHVSQCS